MKDHSIFLNVKELRGESGTHRFTQHMWYSFYEVWKLHGKAFVLMGTVKKIERESNKKLYDRGVVL